MSANLRIRLKFESTLVSQSQKCWFTFDGEKCKLVSDVRHLIASRFSLKKPQSVQLYMDDFLIPTNESAKVIRDNDILQVKAISSVQEDGSSSTSSDDSSSITDAPSQPKSKQARIEPEPKPKQVKKESTKTKAATIQAKQKASSTIKKAKNVVGVTTQSITGALHTKFQSSSSSSSDSSTSSSSSSSSEDDSKKPNINAKNKGKSGGMLKGGTQWDKKGSWSMPGRVRGRNTRGRIMRGGRGWNGTGRNTCPELVVGGPSDILTTRSAIYSRGRGRGRIINDRTRENLQMVVSAVQQTLGKQGLDKTAPSHSPPDRQRTSENSDKISSRGQNSLVELPIPEDVEEEPAPDYSACADLNGPPREGDNLAFKVLELSSTYTPEVSEFKEGTVIDYDSTTKKVKVKFSESCLKRLARAKRDKATATGKFALTDEEQDDESDLLQEQSTEIQLGLDELIEPKLLTCTPTNKNA